MLQRTLLPPALPTIPGLELEAAFQPAGEGTDLGGDFYDAVEVGDGEWLVVVGDVSGKGAEAAAVSALARHSLWAAAARSEGPCDIIATINNVLLRTRPAATSRSSPWRCVTKPIAGRRRCAPGATR